MEFSFLEDEKFDFDLPLSPTEDERNLEVEDDDDEIFFGPVGHKERCVATNAATKATKILDDIENTRTLSPLNAEQVVEIFKEATSMAVMLKSCSSDACSDSEDQDRRKDFPELIADIDNKKSTRVLDKTQDENDVQTDQSADKIAVESNDDGCDGFVVRRRALKERNSVVNDKESSQLQRIKATASSQKATSRKTKSAVTPTRNSLSTSRTERYNTSSSASDTSFGEEKAKKSGLKAPGFSSCPRRRSSSNSSTSSTSSLPSFNLNETFTIAKASDKSKSTNIKPTNRKTQPATKGMLTKAITSKPLFAKPSEVPKTSKLQPIKVQTRNMSCTGLRSPAKLKANARPLSAGSTPLKAQTPKAERTPGNRTTPMRRRVSNASASSTALKGRLNTSGLALPEKAVTPRSGIPGIVGRGKTGGAIAKRPNSAMKGTDKMNTKLIPQKPSTPENRLKKNAGGTPEKTVATPEDKKKPGSARKRRSFLPTPNLKNTESKTAQPSSPAAINKSVKSPDTSKTIERARNLIKKLDLNPESPKNEASSSKMSEDKTNEAIEKDVESNSTSPPIAKLEEVPDLMIQESPPVPKALLVDVVTDPFSPGIDSPNFATDEVLHPIVISSDTKDLIDLSYQSPKPEVDLIDLAAKSPLVEAKLVDI